MNAVNAVPLLILVWTFTAVCDDVQISVSCEDVTGTVGEEVTLTCSVSLSQECSERCITRYKFNYSKNFINTENCSKEFPEGSCEQRNSFTCRFTPTTATTGQFTFFVQPKCGPKGTGFTVNITAPKEGDNKTITGDKPEEVIPAVVGCFFIILIIVIVTLTIIHKTKLNYSKLCGFQMRICLGRRHDEDNSNCPESVI